MYQAQIRYGVLLRLVIKVILFCYLSSCSNDRQADLVKVGFDELPKFDYQNFLPAFKTSCKSLSGYSNKQVISKKLLQLSLSDMKDICADAKQIAEHEMLDLLHNSFDIYKLSGKPLYTGYYIPEIKASYYKNEYYQYPIYALPANDIKDKYTRQQIRLGAFKEEVSIIAFAESDIDLFFLHIQGSGILSFPNGEKKILAYAGKNNHDYYAIGRYLKQHKLLKDINAYSIKEYLSKYSEQKNEIMDLNSSYIYFKLTDKKDIYGAQSSALTPLVSLAIAKEYIPYGIPLIINTEIPDRKYGKLKMTKLMLAQDTGSAINSELKADIYFGLGKEAEYRASHMKNFGEMFILMPKKNAQ